MREYIHYDSIYVSTKIGIIMNVYYKTRKHCSSKGAISHVCLRAILVLHLGNQFLFPYMSINIFGICLWISMSH